MLYRLLFIFGITTTLCRAQTGVDCGVKMTAPQLQNHYARVQSSNALLPHDTCLNRELSIVFHVVLDSSGQPGVTAASMDGAIDKLNAAWKPICISFKKCSVNYIPNYNYNQWTDTQDEPTCFPNYCVDKTINIFLVENILSPSNAGGYAGEFSLGNCNRIVELKSAVNGNVTIHEMGHFFGLPHTWVVNNELVIRSNCYNTGDGFCDTESDPYPQGKDPNEPCGFKAGPKDANNNYYTPPVDNFMTYFKGCNCRFTQEQYNFMAYEFLTKGTFLH
jgi:hypothetical protein